jgi:hypothetical protein
MTRIRYIAPFAIRTGYAQAAHDYLSALVACGTEVDILPLNPGGLETLDARYHHLAELVNGDSDDITHQVVHTIPAACPTFVEGDYAPDPGVKRICITTWETDKLPDEFAVGLVRTFDRIIVPSQWNYETFVAAGIPASLVSVVPHTYDPGFWKPPDDGRWELGWQKPEPLAFYTIGVWGARKNIIGTILAYWHAFSDPSWAGKVKLTVLAPPPPDGLLEDFVARCALRHYGAIDFITRTLSETELRQLHIDNQVFVSATRGEAWHLGAFESAIMGNRLIVPYQGGQRDFMTWAGNFAVVPYQMTPVAPENHAVSTINVAGLRLKSMARVAPTGLAADQCWAEPDLLAMATRMREAAAYPITRPSLQDMRQFTYGVVGPQLRRVIEEA